MGGYMNTHEPVVQQMRQEALEIFQAGLTAVDPIEAINRHVRLSDDTLRIDDRRIDLKNIERVLIVGAGKAVAPMAKALEDLLGDRIAKGVIVVKEGHGLPLKHVKICEGGHPVPDEGGIRGTEEILSEYRRLAGLDQGIAARSDGDASRALSSAASSSGNAQ